MAQQLELRGVHVFTKAPGTRQFQLTKTNPYMRLACGPEVLFIQNGTVFSEGGPPLKELPGWFEGELNKCSNSALAECGWKISDTLRLPGGKVIK